MNVELKSVFVVPLGGSSKRSPGLEAIHREADEPVEGLDEVDSHLACLVRAGPLDPEAVGIGIRKSFEAEEGALRLHVQHVSEDVVLAKAIRASGGRVLKKILLGVAPAGLEVVEGVFVRFEANDLHDSRGYLGFLGSGKALWSPVLPHGGEGHLLEAR